MYPFSFQLIDLILNEIYVEDNLENWRMMGNSRMMENNQVGKVK